MTGFRVMKAQKRYRRSALGGLRPFRLDVRCGCPHYLEGITGRVDGLSEDFKRVSLHGGSSEEFGSIVASGQEENTARWLQLANCNRGFDSIHAPKLRRPAGDRRCIPERSLHRFHHCGSEAACIENHCEGVGNHRIVLDHENCGFDVSYNPAFVLGIAGC